MSRPVLCVHCGALCSGLPRNTVIGSWTSEECLMMEFGEFCSRVMA